MEQLYFVNTNKINDEIRPVYLSDSSCESSRSSSPIKSPNTSPNTSINIEQCLRKGDLKLIKSFYPSSTKIPGELVHQNLIVDCSKGLCDIPKNKMSIHGGILQNRFRTWRYIVERLDRKFSEHEIDAILIVINVLYKDVNWKHPFWNEMSCHPKINSLAKRWIQNQTI